MLQKPFIQTLVKMLVVLLSLLISSYSHAENKLEGHWIGFDNQSIAEFTDNEIIITLISEEDSNTKISANVEQFDESRFRLINKENRVAAVLVMDWAQKAFSIQNLQRNFLFLSFKPAPQITEADLIGTWYANEKEYGYETSSIITQKGSVYDFDFLEINHDTKSYSRDIEKDVKFTLKNGFTFIDDNSENEGEEEYSYYLMSFTKDSLNYSDAYGYQWSEYRKEGAVHPKIPDGYTEKKEE